MALVQVTKGIGISGITLSFLSVPLGLPDLWGTHLPVWEGMPISFLVILERKCLRDN